MFPVSHFIYKSVGIVINTFFWYCLIFYTCSIQHLFMNLSVHFLNFLECLRTIDFPHLTYSCAFQKIVVIHLTNLT